MQRLASGVAVAGAAFGALTSIVGSAFNPLGIPFAIWSALPYAILWFVGRYLRDGWPAFGAGTAGLAADAGIRAAVFLWPRGSTPAIALVFSPALIGAIVMPAGAALGWLMGRAWRSSAAGRALVAMAGPVILGLVVLGFARPELFPTNVLRRRAVLERIGPPRIVRGADRFVSDAMDARPAWYVAAALDDEPGEEIAVVDHSGASVFDPATLRQKRHIAFGGQPGRLWGSFSTLFRTADGTIAVADTGGGFSKTLAKTLEGSVLWEHRPHPTLAPTAMRPADLDRDGATEFYAASNDFVARLDAAGREVWRRPATLASLLATLPATSDTPAWVVAMEYGRRVLVWDAGGTQLAEHRVAAEDSPLAAADSPWGRLLVYGGRSARGVDLAGTERFTIDLGDFTLSQACGVRIGTPSAMLLALTGSTDRDTRRARLLLVDEKRQIIYDEIHETLPRLFVATLPDESQMMFVAGGSGLLRLRLRNAEEQPPGR